jgi:ribosome-associated protein
LKTLTLSNFILDTIDDMKAQDIQLLDVRDKSSITDVMILCTGTSTRHVAAIAEHLKQTAPHHDFTTYNVSGEKEAEWVVVDLGDALVHIMQEDARNLYQLEKLWS